MQVQKTLEQIDCVHRLCEKYPDHLEFAYTAADVRRSAQIMLDVRPTHWLIRAQVRRIVKDGKLASMAGLEGGHQINGSLATLRMY